MERIPDGMATVNTGTLSRNAMLVPPDPDFGEPLDSDPKREYIADLRMQELRDDSHRILARLAASGRAIAITKIHLQEATEAVEMAEASLMMSEAYAGGKNAEVRKAWLIQQRENDPALSEALGAKRRLELEMAIEDADLDASSHEWQLRIAELRLISAQLLFLAGGAL